MKHKKKSNLMYRLLLLVLCIIIGVCLFNIGKILYGYYEGTKVYNQVQELAGVKEFDINKINFEALREKNKDIRGWLYSEDTVINYPIVQGKDNDYYLYRMFNKQWNEKGSLFVDYRCEKPFKDFNTIVYGHRMKDGSMFHAITEYSDREYYKKHKKMILLTPDKKYNLHIFCIARIPANSELYKTAFHSNSEKREYINRIEKLSETKMDDVKLSTSDKIVMLSTCTRELDDDRIVVYGKLEEIK